MDSLYMSIVTNVGQSAGQYGESEGNTSRMQYVVDEKGDKYPMYSSEAYRSVEREQHRNLDPDRHNRSRIVDSAQLTAHYKEPINPTRFADDKLYGGFHAVQGNNSKAVGELKTTDFHGLTPLTNKVVKMIQSPNTHRISDGVSVNGKNSGLLFKETCVTRYQHAVDFPCLGLKEDQDKIDYARLFYTIASIKSIGGNSTRHYFPVEPESIIIRHCTHGIRGFKTYPFDQLTNGTVICSSVTDMLMNGDVDPREFYVGGTVFRELEVDQLNKYRTAIEVLDAVCFKLTGFTINGVPPRVLEERGKEVNFVLDIPRSNQ